MTWWSEDETTPHQPMPPADVDPTLPPRPDPTAVWPPTAGGGVGGPPSWGGGYGSWPPPSPPGGHRRDRRRRRNGLWAAALATLAVALGAGVAVASGNGAGLFHDTSAPSATTRPANGVSQAKLDPTAVADRNDPAIVDVTSVLDQQSGEAAGTGMILTANGEILTNNHVIDGASSITVKISNGSRSFRATVLGTDPTDDVAVIKAQGASGLPTIAVGDSSSVNVGDAVVAIGNALNKPGPPTVTEGSVTALGRSINVRSDTGNQEQLSNLIETDAQLEPGNSGGPLFDAAGRVIGMNTAASTGAIPQSGTNDGFAIPLNDAINIVHQIESGKTGGNVQAGQHGFLGVSVLNSSSGRGGGGGSGVQVQRVGAGTPAESVGITAGDTIVAVDGTSITTSQQLSTLIGAKRPGDVIRVTWADQNGDQQSANVRLTTNTVAN